MENFINGLMNYPGIAFLMLLENVLPPLPSEVIMPTAGVRAGTGQLSIVGVILAGIVGSLAGQTALYYLGRVVPQDKLEKWADKHGSWLALDGEEVRKAREWFDKHGKKAALFGRLVPGVRSLVSIPAGLAKMPLPTFLLFSAIGTAIWTAALAFLGYFLGQNYQTVGRYVDIGGKVIIGIVVVVFIAQVIKKRREKAEKEKQGNAGSQGRERTA